MLKKVDKVSTHRIWFGHKYGSSKFLLLYTEENLKSTFRAIQVITLSAIISTYVIDIAWQLVLYGLYSTEPEGHCPEGVGYISCTACDWHAIRLYHISQGWGCVCIFR